MILIDTSVWIDHLNGPLPQMSEAAKQGVFMHPFVLGEIALGSLANRSIVLRDLSDLPIILPAAHHHVMQLIESAGLYATGLGYVDLHLLASARVTEDCTLWSRDKRLRAAAARFGVAADFD